MLITMSYKLAKLISMALGDSEPANGADWEARVQ
jgi:hypothetical protein